ncbi:ATP-dependent helicase BRM [Acorus gramineus]|uniref:ATP-dependent helicase BRM n=1 Tax=Acorus gramineus TaxID=55184 RepID=A0AAV9A936_ACOGR|nr:ATP-dependent helicase BRM [Acorus gramineus]
MDLSQQQGAGQAREENHNKGHAPDQHAQNPMQQAYLQYAFQAAQQQKSYGAMQFNQQGKMGMVGPSSKEHEVHMNNLKMQELMSFQAANQGQASMFKKSVEHFPHSEKQSDQGLASNDQRSELRPTQTAVGQPTSTNMARARLPSPHTHSNMQAVANNQMAVAQLQAFQAWAKDNNIDLSLPAGANMIPQLYALWQSKMGALQRANDPNVSASHLTPVRQQVMSSPAGSENSAHGNSVGDLSVQANSVKGRQHALPPEQVSSPMGNPGIVNSNSNILVQHQQIDTQNRENQNERAARHQIPSGNGGPIMHPSQLSTGMAQRAQPSHSKNAVSGSETPQMQYHRQMQQSNAPASQSPASPSETSGAQFPSHSGPAAQTAQQCGFTKQQLHVLKAQILAFRRLKRGEALPREVLQSIAPPPLDLQQQRISPLPGVVNQDRSAGKSVEVPSRNVETIDKTTQITSFSKGQSLLEEESFAGDEKAGTVGQFQGVAPGPVRETIQVESVAKPEQSNAAPIKSEQEVERVSQKIPVKDVFPADKGKALPHQVSATEQMKKPTTMGTTPPPRDVGASRKYCGPLFDFPCFARKNDPVGAMTLSNSTSNLMLSYDVKDLLLDEGMDVLNKKRMDNLKKVEDLLAVNLERKRIRPDLVLRLQIEEKKLRLTDFQARMRDEIDQQQQEIMGMPDRLYRKFVRVCERQRAELTRQVQLSQRVIREKQIKSIFLWRKRLLESHWAIRDARTTRNRGIAKYHERMLREFSKKNDDDRNKRMEALKNNDVDRYREMLLEQQTNIPGDASQRYAVLSSFLSQTEEYLHKLGGKITAAKNHQEIEEAANAAATNARLQGLSEEEVKIAASCAGEEILIRKRFSEMNARRDNSSVNKYYNLAHAVHERILRQPSMLRAGTLRDYQLVGLQWMLSLYNNKLNGILADEMGLGKTVQVMALIAYLMEFKGNYGPHLIIVPNAVLVNWKSELHNWLPSASCIFYVGAKDQRSKLFSHEVCAMKFNVLVTTYEFVMYDRSKLSKIEWKYIIIDEAQRMKDRESVLARDLDKYKCQRRLLLTGTPLQNDLKELWSLLNLLLPEVFDNRKAFHDWFSKPFQRDAPSHNAEEDDWLETEKKVIIIHRLHQILEPFMLRRRVEDVEGSLPPKVSVVLRCRMSAIQGAIYDWIKSTGTIRVNPDDEKRKVDKNPVYQVRMYKNLNNKCMELRKTCNHPLLNYPYFDDLSKVFIVRSCGKLWMLDRILIKLQRTGHRVLLFSTMTKLLDILEEYLQWRHLIYRRIDGTTSLEDRESAIVDFNSPGSSCFIFLLSIRAAGRGLNLQTADTVVIYDPDPNPQNEEQAVARAHRIGQTREVKVIYMEAVVDKISSYQKEDELRSGGTADSEDDLAGKDRYIGSIESLIRNNIQQYKIDMANEVINAGRFDQRTTHEERRMTLETLLHDEERYQETVHDVPSLQEVNRMIARSEEEIELFDQMDEEFDWTGEMMKHHHVPKWLRAGSREVNVAIASLSKKPSKIGLVENADMESNEVPSGVSPSKSERRRGRPRASSGRQNFSIYRELDDEIEEDEVSSEERNEYSMHEEDGETGEYEDEEFSGAVGVPPSNRESEDEGLVCDGGAYESPQPLEGARISNKFEEAGSSGSSSGSRKVVQLATPSISPQKFGSLSALDARSGSLSKSMPEELEEGEIAFSGDSHMDLQQSGSWTHDRDDGEDEQVLQPTIKRKRSMRMRPRHHAEKLEEKSSRVKFFPLHGNPSPLDHEYDLQSRTDPELEPFSEPVADRTDHSDPVLKQRRNLPSRKGTNTGKSHVIPKPSRLNSLASEDNHVEFSRESWNCKTMNSGGPIFSGSSMSDVVRRKCKNVISKLQRRIDKDGQQIVPLLSDMLKRNGKSSFLVSLQRIDQRIDSSEYKSEMDFVADVQSTFKTAVQFYGNSNEVRTEARKLQDIFFEIMRIAFPDMDIREAKNALTFLGPAPTSGPSQKQPHVGQAKRHNKLMNNAEPDPVPSRLMSTDESNRTTQVSVPKSQKEFRLPGGLVQGQSSDGPHLSTHPGELVICKKKRNDRDKTMVKPRIGPMSPSIPVSPTGSSRNVRAQTSVPPVGRVHPPLQQVSSVGGGPGGIIEAQWAKPVKRMRTDTALSNSSLRKRAAILGKRSSVVKVRTGLRIGGEVSSGEGVGGDDDGAKGEEGEERGMSARWIRSDHDDLYD